MPSPIFELKDLSFRYNPRAPFALKGVNLRLHAGEIFGLGMVVFGGYRILNALIAEAEKEEKACEKQPDEPR